MPLWNLATYILRRRRSIYLLTAESETWFQKPVQKPGFRHRIKLKTHLGGGGGVSLPGFRNRIKLRTHLGVGEGYHYSLIKTLHLHLINLRVRGKNCLDKACRILQEQGSQNYRHLYGEYCTCRTIPIFILFLYDLIYEIA